MGEFSPISSGHSTPTPTDFPSPNRGFETVGQRESRPCAALLPGLFQQAENYPITI